MYVLFSIIQMIREHFPYKEFRTVSRNTSLSEDLLFNDEELSELYQWIGETFDVYIHESARFDTIGELADYIDSQADI